MTTYNHYICGPYFFVADRQRLEACEVTLGLSDGDPRHLSTDDHAWYRGLCNTLEDLLRARVFADGYGPVLIEAASILTRDRVNEIREEWTDEEEAAAHELFTARMPTKYNTLYKKGRRP